MKKKYRVITHGMLLIFSIGMLFPFLWMVLSALKTKEEIMNTTTFFAASPQWGNIVEVIFNSPVLRYVFNSFYVSCFIVILQIFSGALLAYALTFFIFKGREILFGIVLGTYMLPSAATYIPCYILLSKLGLLNSHAGLIISCTVNVFGIFLLRQAFLQIPYGLVEAAKIDGASDFKILWRIVYPVTKSSFITFLLTSFIASYNSYLWPSLITDTKELSLVSQGIRRFFLEGGAYGTNWPMVMAASTVVVLPLIFLYCFSQNFIISGISDTGIKG